MLFRDTWRQVLDLTKTETRRVMHPAAKVVLCKNSSEVASVHINERLQYKKGGIYCVKSYRTGNSLYWRPAATPQKYEVWSTNGRSKPPAYLNFCRAEIKLDSIHVEFLEDIEEAGAIREGYPQDCDLDPLEWYKQLWIELNGSWEKQRIVFVYRFHLVNGGIRHGYTNLTTNNGYLIERIPNGYIQSERISSAAAR